MYGQDSRGKLFGCGFGLAISILVFYGMIVIAKRAEVHIKARRAAKSMATGTQNQVGLSIVINAYAAKNGNHFPPMDSPEKLRAALVPKYLLDPSVLINPRDRQPYTPNASLSGKSRLPYMDRAGTTYLLGDSTAAPDGSRSALYLDGTVRLVTQEQWAAMNAAK